MTYLIDKSALVAEIQGYISGYKDILSKVDEKYLKYAEGIEAKIDILQHLLSFLDTLEVKTDEDNSLEKFKSLQPISGDLRQTLKVWGYAPNLYFFDGMWHVGWFSCEETDIIKDFEGNTPEEAIDKAYNWFHSTFCNS